MLSGEARWPAGGQKRDVESSRPGFTVGTYKRIGRLAFVAIAPGTS